MDCLFRALVLAHCTALTSYCPRLRAIPRFFKKFQPTIFFQVTAGYSVISFLAPKPFDNTYF